MRKPIDVLMISSVFGERKIAEPMGVAILSASLRRRGFEVVILEPSVDGWSVDHAVQEMTQYAPSVIGVSMLRDKHVEDVLQLVQSVRHRFPGSFICVGGHGPSIAVKAISPGTPRPMKSDGAATPRQHPAPVCRTSFRLDDISASIIIDPELTDRGKGPGDVTGPTPSQNHSPYFDKSQEYLEILSHIDAYVIGEADVSFPNLVELIISGGDWRQCGGLAFYDVEGKLEFTALPKKIDDLDSIPNMARDVYEMYLTKYERALPASIVATRGCNYRCTFCSVVQYESLQRGFKHRFRSNNNILNEMIYLNQKYGTTEFNFEDDNFIDSSNRGRNRLLDFCDRVLRLPFEVRFSIFCRSDSVDLELFGRLYTAGLSGIYFGLESVFQDDLQFFQKDASSQDADAALEILYALGFSLDVDAVRRIMLGYITWHPLTTFDSLRATGAFVSRHLAPPKLLRRVLRLYSQTSIIRDVDKLGLIDAEHPRGWRFKDERLERLEAGINLFFGRVNTRRDQLRTLEKAARRFDYVVPELDRIAELRAACDRLLYRAFESAIRMAEVDDLKASQHQVDEFISDQSSDFECFCRDSAMIDVIGRGLSACNFSPTITDLFRR